MQAKLQHARTTHSIIGKKKIIIIIIIIIIMMMMMMMIKIKLLLEELQVMVNNANKLLRRESTSLSKYK